MPNIKDKLVETIIKCRRGSMDDKQFRATVKNAFDSLLKEQSKEELRVLTLKEMQKLENLASNMWDSDWNDMPADRMKFFDYVTRLIQKHDK